MRIRRVLNRFLSVDRSWRVPLPAAPAVRRRFPSRDVFHHQLRLEPLEDRRMLTTYLVDSLGDSLAADGWVTLREALEAANTNVPVNEAPAGSSTETDYIAFDASLSGGIIAMDSTQFGQLEIRDDVEIEGLGAERLAIDAGGQSRVFYVGSEGEPVVASLAGLTITGGVAFNGAGIYSMYESTVTVTVTDLIISGNTATGPSSGGAGIWNVNGTFHIIDSIITGNVATGNNSLGGGVFNSYGVLTVTNSVLSGNSAQGQGGGIYSFGGTIEVTNSTLSGNSAGSEGGGIHLAGGNPTIANSIVALGEAPSDPDLSGSETLAGDYNLIGVWDAGTPPGEHSKWGTSGAPLDPGFVRDPSPGGDDIWGTEDDDCGDLHLTSMSPAINAGSNELAKDASEVPLATDLDGKQRIVYGTVDMGAYELCVPGDANYDGVVDQYDMAILAANWGGQSVTWAEGDFDSDGQVGPADACILAAHWGATFVPPGEETSSEPAVPSDPATPSDTPATSMDTPLIGPLPAGRSTAAGQLIEPVGSVGQAVPDTDSDVVHSIVRQSLTYEADQQPVAPSETTTATYDAALVEDFGPRLGQPSVERQRLAWSRALARRWAHRQQDEKPDQAALAIDLLLS